ncbi:MAG: XTP/dITP diphosphatase [Staphylothermus sp.]|nr:XTP/dITP diphosphatase [Staphylothermus sp.]
MPNNTVKKTIYFLTNNIHKYEEVKPIAEKYGFQIEMCNDAEKMEIQSNDLLEIAKYAALHAYAKIGKPLMVEDAGLFVHALNGFPGPYSSYVFKTIGYQGILKLLEDTEERKASFRSAVVLIHEPFIITCIGETTGYITTSPRGNRGFGFDPIFVPNDSSKTFAEMTINEKNMFSHRAKAVECAFKKLRKMTELGLKTGISNSIDDK